MNKINQPPSADRKLLDKKPSSYIKESYRRKFDRYLLPTPSHYYSTQFSKLKIRSEWVSVHCCFHTDDRPSLRLHMISGAFRCFGCGAKGCDIIAFHRLRYKLNFINTVDLFGAWHYDK